MITNTSNKRREEWLFGGNPKAIEAQEQEGQEQLAASSQLPVKGMTPEAAAKHGISIVKLSEGDPLFLDVKLPDGWMIQPTSHHMWSDLLDASGDKVASIFYKAAFYDRSAFIRWEEKL